MIWHSVRLGTQVFFINWTSGRPKTHQNELFQISKQENGKNELRQWTRTTHWVPTCFSKFISLSWLLKTWLFYTPLARICRMPMHFSQSLEYYKAHKIINNICIYSFFLKQLYLLFHISLSTMLNLHVTKVVSCTLPVDALKRMHLVCAIEL